MMGPLASPPEIGMRIITLNLLYDSVPNLAPAWAVRRPRAAAFLGESGADIVCLQEVSPRQLRDVAEDLPGYRVLAGEPAGATIPPAWAAPLRPLARRVAGDYLETGEHCPILARKDLVIVEESSCSWLSRHEGGDTPHVVHRARLRLGPGRKPCTVYNAHLGFLPGRVERPAIELRDRLDREWNGEPQILAGDFNARPGGAVLRALLDARAGATPAPRDAWDAARERSGPGGTLHWGLGLPGPRIDYVLVRPGLEVTRAVHGSGAGALPSDHHPVTVDIDLK